MFPEAIRAGVIFSWGESIYNPSNVHIPPHLLAHEAVHGARQVAYKGLPRTPEDRDLPIREWWNEYATNPMFRLNEELLAHHAEYRAYAKRHGATVAIKGLMEIADRLSGPLYGNLLTHNQAQHAILTGEVA